MGIQYHSDSLESLSTNLCIANYRKVVRLEGAHWVAQVQAWVCLGLDPVIGVQQPNRMPLAVV